MKFQSPLDDNVAILVIDHYTKMRLNLIWVSLDFE
jgi:hypothetical protein